MWFVVTISAESTALALTPASKNERRSIQFRMKGSLSCKSSSISEKGRRSFVALREARGPIWRKDLNREGAYLAAAVERTPKSPRIDRGGRAIAAVDNGSTASCETKITKLVCRILFIYWDDGREENSLKVSAIQEQHLDLHTVEGPAVRESETVMRERERERERESRKIINE